MATTLIQHQGLKTHLNRLRDLAFVRGVELGPAKFGPYDPDIMLTIKTPTRGYKLAVEARATFLDRATTNALISEHTALQRRYGVPLFLVARYIPRPTGERLAEAGVNFVDRVGNMHVKLGNHYHALLLGRKQGLPEPSGRRPGPAFIQFLFTLLVEREAAGWPIRKIAGLAGIGKTMAAISRQRLVREGFFRSGRGMDRKRLGEQFVSGYSQTLRPNLLLGRYRPFQRDPDLLLTNVAQAAKRHRLNWAVTGGPAAYVLERFYRGEELPVFLAGLSSEMQRELRLAPDARGPVILLRPFGKLFAWRELDGLTLAHPWLIYAELLHSGEPRALEAADQIRENYLIND